MTMHQQIGTRLATMPREQPRRRAHGGSALVLVTMFRCFAFEHGKLIAAGRVLADGRDCAYLCDVAVLPSHQGRGLGRDIVSRLLERSKSHRKIILYAVPGREELYRGLGFRRMRTAMAIFENQTEAFARGLLAEI